MICVVGSMRSGTSLTTGMLAKSAAYAGETDDLYDGMPHDPTGIWEHKGMSYINRKLLKLVNGDFLSLDKAKATAEIDNWKDRMSNRELRMLRFQQDQILASFARSNTGKNLKQHLIWKDPRTSLLLGYWYESLYARALAGEFDSSKKFKLIWVVRNPEESSRSMAAMGYGRIKNSQHYWELWHIYNQAILSFVRSTPIEFKIVFHKNIISETQSVLEGIFDFLEIDLAQSHLNAALSLYNPSYYRHRAASNADKSTVNPSQVSMLYDSIRALGGDTMSPLSH